MDELPTLYSYDSKGKVRQWRTWAEGSIVYVESGLQEGKKITKSYEAKPKNIGRANETTGPEQALLECQSKWNKQKDKDYHESLEEYVPLENPMLAYPFEKKAHKVVYPCYVQPKLDGVRCLIKLEGDQVIYKSRGNKLYTTLGHLDGSARVILGELPEGTMLDGEIYCHGMPLNEITSAVKKFKEDSLKLEFWWYDVVIPDEPYIGRKDWMNEIHDGVYQDAKLRGVVLTDTHAAENQSDVNNYHDFYTKNDFEGLMIKNLAGMYTLNNRSADLLKYKRFDDDEFKIVDHKLDKDGRIVLVCQSNNTTFDVVPKGGHRFREQVLKDFKEQWLGNLLKVQYQGYGVNGVPIFPVGLGLRETDSRGNVL